VNKARILGEGFLHFMNREWIFDNASVMTLQKHIDLAGEPINFDVRKITWTNLVQNHAYGVKRYIL
jgi:nuclear transport factor 2 (NTF2) superfamily protein